MENTDNIKYIHVAGTNGKGSVCAFIADALSKSGKKTGKFTSPHVVDITERITIDNVPIKSDKLEQLSAGKIDCPKKTSQFERLMNSALAYFDGNKAEYAVIEAGIGGLLDCTNIITPVVSVITKIGFDHTELLGCTLGEIALHKAGIIKQGVPAVTDPTQPPEAMEVIRQTAAAKNSPLFIPDISGEFFRIPKTGMFGEHQKYNAITAAEALRILGIQNPDFSRVRLPGRFQTVCENPLVIVDGAHNIGAVKAVKAALSGKEFPDKKIIVFGMLKSKDYNACVNELAYLADEIVFTDGFSPDAVRNSGLSISSAIEKAVGLAGKDGMVIVCGSLYLAGEAISLYEHGLQPRKA
jgi:dihydrofolate synthase/folylpolyglutamate synthase